MIERIGFMQGRLSPLVDGKIQAFPSEHWCKELIIAAENNLLRMEWTLDYDGLYDNPLMSDKGQQEIRQILYQTGVKISSLTGDLFMQKPFWKETNKLQQELMADFREVCQRCASIGISYIVVPLVDNGSLKSSSEEELLIEHLLDWSNKIQPNDVIILFESDFAPQELSSFISKFPIGKFGINYDTGNSASLGFDPEEEITSYGARILNVHIKDRLYNGKTVPLGEGNARLDDQIRLLENIGYNGSYVLQTARAADDQHLSAILNYRKIVMDLIVSANNYAA